MSHRHVEYSGNNGGSGKRQRDFGRDNGDRRFSGGRNNNNGGGRFGGGGGGGGGGKRLSGA